MNNRFDYVQFDKETTDDLLKIKEKFQELEKMIDSLENGRAKSLVYTSLEESYMWVGKALRDEQIQKNKQSELNESRNNI